ncbi:MAG: AMP-binding protein [Syntrophales bacterium]|jgi:long-chain acyl-CoA synthetase|nr:AMP-binding protein [Syntrophales bacterium]MDY0043834.1 AMP-binding protein [Syntrophales bacterium]
MEERIWHRHYDYNVPLTVRRPRLAVPDLLQIPANAYPDKAAVHFLGSEITFWQLRQQVLRMANALGAMGVGKGDRVGLHLPTCPQYLIAYYGVLSLGAIVVNLNPLYTAGELTGVFQSTGITTLFTIDTAVPTVNALLKNVEIKRIIVTRLQDYAKSDRKKKAPELEKGWHYFSKILDECTSTKRPRVSILPEDPALIQFTGGTTGIPKGAVLSHYNVVGATVGQSLWLSPIAQLTPPERRVWIGAIPFFHIYGNIGVINLSVFNCATQVLVPEFNLDEMMDLLDSYKEILAFPTVPTMISAIINHPRADAMGLDRKLGLLNSGGAPMPVEIINKIKDMGIFYSEGWSMSETTCAGTQNPMLGLSKTGSIGIPVIDTDVRLVDLSEGVNEVPSGEPGEMIIKSPTVTRGYWNNPEETAGQIKDGWLSTGDIAIQDEDGYFYIVDRKKDMIIAGGFNIYPREIDEVLHQHPKIQAAISVGVPHEYRGETVKAFVVLKEGVTATADEIISFCKQKLTSYKVPKLVEFRKDLPQSAVGKVLRRILRDEEIKKNREQK